MTEEIIENGNPEDTKGLDVNEDDNNDANPDETDDKQDVNDNPEDKQDDNNQDNNTDDEIYGAPEKFDYSEIKLPEGMNLDEELLGEFEPIAKKLNLSNKSANELMSLAVKLSNKNLSIVQDAINQAQIAEKNSYLQMLDKDTELNAKDSAKYEPYLSVAIQGLNAVATKGFKEFIDQKGLTYHPEFIKVFHKVGELCSESRIPDGFPSGKELDAADILYGTQSEES